MACFCCCPLTSALIVYPLGSACLGARGEGEREGGGSRWGALLTLLSRLKSVQKRIVSTIKAARSCSQGCLLIAGSLQEKLFLAGHKSLLCTLPDAAASSKALY